MSRFFEVSEQAREAWRRQMRLAVKRAGQTGKTCIRELPPAIQVVRPVFSCHECGGLVASRVIRGPFRGSDAFQVCSLCGHGQRKWSRRGADWDWPDSGD